MGEKKGSVVLQSSIFPILKAVKSVAVNEIYFKLNIHL